MSAGPQKSRSKTKIILAWVLLIGTLVLGTMIGFMAATGRHPERPHSYGVGFAIVLFIVGGFFLTGGLIAYFVVMFTECFTFNYQQPVWGGFKVRMYAANIVVQLLAALGVGLMFSAVVTPILSNLGVSGPFAFMGPVLLSLVVMQIVMVWVNIWSPVTKRLILKRLRAKGLTETQLASGVLIGLSDASRSSFKKFFAIEDDVGMLWFDSNQLIYWGDNDQLAIRHEQLLDVERGMDSGSTSALGGTVHVILRALMPDGTERRIRLHNEGIWTMGGRRVAMDELGERIESWRKAVAATVAQG